MTMYEEQVLDHYKNPRKSGGLPQANIVVEDTNTSCGDSIVVSLEVRNGKIIAARQTCKGCAISTAGASMLFETVEGKTVEELIALPKEELLREFGSTLSVSRVKCALLGYAALKKALVRYETDRARNA